MQTHLGHVMFGIAPEHTAFYRDLMQFLGWQVIFDDYGLLGIGDSNGASFWFGPQEKAGSNDYDFPGVNHLGIHTTNQADVDTVVAYLAEHQVQALFETPRHRPDFSQGDDQTYYQVMFESPDRILFEVYYTGPKT